MKILITGLLIIALLSGCTNTITDEKDYRFCLENPDEAIKQPWYKGGGYITCHFVLLEWCETGQDTPENCKQYITPESKG